MTLESSLDCKETKPVNPKGNQSWIFIGRTDAEPEAPILWPSYVKRHVIWKDPDARKDWRWEEKGTTEDEMVGWHHQLNGHEFEQRYGDGQGSLACCSPWGTKNWTQLSSWTATSSYRWEGDCVLCFVYQSCLTPGTVAHRLLHPQGFSRQEYWSRLPCLPPGDLPNPGFVPRSPTFQADSLPSKPSENEARKNESLGC